MLKAIVRQCFTGFALLHYRAAWATFYRGSARFLRGAAPMKILAIVLSALVLGCQQEDTGGEAADTTRAPIGPGSEESVLVPPDTPMTRGGVRTAPDTTRARRDTIR